MCELFSISVMFKVLDRRDLIHDHNIQHPMLPSVNVSVTLFRNGNLLIKRKKELQRKRRSFFLSVTEETLLSVSQPSEICGT